MIGLAGVAGWTSGINLYATVLLVGAGSRLGWFTVPPGLEFASSDVALAASGGLYLLQFVAGKVPGLDALWDLLHTVVRPLGGAGLGWLLTGGEVDVASLGTAALGGGAASLAHTAKTVSRFAINASPEPASNFLASLAEDGLVVGLVFLAMTNPRLAILLFGVLVLLTGLVLWALWRGARAGYARLRGRWTRRTTSGAPAGHSGSVAPGGHGGFDPWPSEALGGYEPPSGPSRFG